VAALKTFNIIAATSTNGGTYAEYTSADSWGANFLTVVSQGNEGNTVECCCA
jgi:hypothetical protein